MKIDMNGCGTADKKAESVIALVVMLVGVVLTAVVSFINAIAKGWNEHAAAQNSAAGAENTHADEHVQKTDDEQAVILRMLSEKKINADEANRLLSALEGNR